MKKRKLLTISLLMLIIILPGCSSRTSSDAAAPDGYPSYGKGQAEYPTESPTEDNVSEGGVTDTDKNIFSYQMQFESEDFDITKDAITDLNKENKGYIQYSNITRNSHYSGQIYRKAFFTLRVPSSQAENMVNSLKKVGHLITESSGSKNVTTEYQDVESRIKALSSQEDRLNQLYNKAEKIEDIITLEARITEVIREKELLSSRLNSMDKDIAYSIIEIQVDEVVQITPQETVKTKFTEKVKMAFSNSFRQFGDTLERSLIGIIYVLPWLLVMGSAIAGILLYRKYKK